jgi:hypothetical protein
MKPGDKAIVINVNPIKHKYKDGDVFTVSKVMLNYCLDSEGTPLPKKNLKPIKPLSNVKVGDWIFTVADGWTKVLTIIEGSDYPIKTISSWYTHEGKLHHEDKHPSAWTYDPFDGTLPPAVFKEGEVIAVSDSASKNWHHRAYSHTTAERKFVDVYGSIWNYARRLTAEEKGE